MDFKSMWASGLIMMGSITVSLAADPAADIAAAPPAATPPAAAPAVFDLFTAVEAAAWGSAQPKAASDFSTRDLRDEGGIPTCNSTSNNDADNPQIKIVAPLLGKSLISPLDIDLQFVPTGRAPIRPDTFRVCYLGAVPMDITKRITDRFVVSQQGLHISGAQLPQGHHRLVLLIADERGRLGRREAVFNID
jgi:hypothetical protein